ncbi:transposase [Candidatus Ventrimonas sp. KK005]
MSLPYFCVDDHTIMINFIENILCHFESCFSRKAAFRWFVVIITGFMLRSDKLGVTSIIRDLALAPGCYESMLHFFRASSWSLPDIRKRWFSAVSQYAPLYKEGSLHVLVGDGVKQSKEGRRMPGVKKLFQESENSAKPEYIHGHMFGGLGILAGNIRNWACIPLSIRLHDGLQAAREWKGASVSATSHVVQMVEDAYLAALTFGDSLLLPDRYFLTVPALEKLKSLNDSGNVHMDIVTKAKKSCTAYQKPGPRKPGRGRPPKKGAAVHLKELFVSHAGQFQETEVELYGKKEKIRYYCIDLLWGQKLYQELRFVLVEMDGSQSILASTSVVLNPLSIIRLYSYRFQIEYTFKELKQQIGAFCYHFWSKYMPKISYYQKKGEPTPMELVAGEKPRKKVLEAVRAIEMHMVLSCIAIGILQSPSISLIGKVNSSQIRYQRTPSRGRVSEATLMYYFRKHFFRLLGQKPELYITQIIQGMQNEPAKPWDSMVS